MRRPPDLFEEYDLSSEELYARRRAEFDQWFEKPTVRLYEAVMLSVRILPCEFYRLKTPQPTSHPPRYPAEFFFKVPYPEFHDRMVLAVAAVREGKMESRPSKTSLDESDREVTFKEFERWALQANVLLPVEWKSSLPPPAMKGLPSQRQKKLNNRLIIVRALMRAARIHDEAALWAVIEAAPLQARPDRTCLSNIIQMMELANTVQEDRTPSQNEIMQLPVSSDELIKIIGALLCALEVDLTPGKSAAKIIQTYIHADYRAKNRETAHVPSRQTINPILDDVRALLSH